MSNLFVIGFDEPHKAEELRLKLQELQGKYVLDLQEMVVVAKDEKGKVKLHQSGGVRTLESPVIPGLCGSLTALICLNATTAAAGSALVALSHTDEAKLQAALTASLQDQPHPVRRRTSYAGAVAGEGNADS